MQPEIEPRFPGPLAKPYQTKPNKIFTVFCSLTESFLSQLVMPKVNEKNLFFFVNIDFVSKVIYIYKRNGILYK